MSAPTDGEILKHVDLNLEIEDPGLASIVASINHQILRTTGFYAGLLAQCSDIMRLLNEYRRLQIGAELESQFPGLCEDIEKMMKSSLSHDY